MRYVVVAWVGPATVCVGGIDWVSVGVGGTGVAVDSWVEVAAGVLVNANVGIDDGAEVKLGVRLGAERVAGRVGRKGSMKLQEVRVNISKTANFLNMLFSG